MKKFTSILATILMVAALSTPAFAKADFGDPGWYQRYKTNGGIQYQYFPNGHPEGNSEWEPCTTCGDNGPVASGNFEISVFAAGGGLSADVEQRVSRCPGQDGWDLDGHVGIRAAPL